MWTVFVCVYTHPHLYIYVVDLPEAAAVACACRIRSVAAGARIDLSVRYNGTMISANIYCMCVVYICCYFYVHAAQRLIVCVCGFQASVNFFVVVVCVVLVLVMLMV